ncbi:MAG: class 1 fructose-bisphosphatase [Phycisphaerae bacterium]
MRHTDADQFITIQQHIMEQQRKHPTATGDFSWLLSGLTLAAGMIQAIVRRAGLVNILGSAESENVHGEQQQKLDVYADRVIERCLESRGNVGVAGSEEKPEPIVLPVRDDAPGRYVVLFDPLDGSGNIDVNVAVGTIFSIYERVTAGPVRDGGLRDVLQPGDRQLAAGYVVYGSSTVLVYTTGDGVHLFTFDPATGAFMLSEERVRIPANGKIYSVNEANADSFPRGVQEFLRYCKSKESGPYSSRYIGSMVADVHRTLLKGGIFMYPQTAKAPRGKLRLMYEANPMAFIIEQAGGQATDGQTNILAKQPAELHERTPLYIGETADVKRVMELLARHA